MTNSRRTAGRSRVTARDYAGTARDLAIIGSKVGLLYALAPIKILAGALDLGRMALAPPRKLRAG